MDLPRRQLARMMVVGGSVCLALGILLLLVKLLIALAWYASGAIMLAGLVLLAIGHALGGRWTR